MPPRTLQQAVLHFSDESTCVEFVARMRWPNGVSCPRCDSTNVTRLATRFLWQCKKCRRQFSVKVGTIFEDSPIPLAKWLPAVWLIASAKNGISSYEISRALDVTQKSAWFMLHRVRLAMQEGTFNRLSGQVEVDETFIGGKARFMHKNRRSKKIKGTGGMGKAAVMGLLERHGPDGHSTVRARMVPTVRRRAFMPEIREHVTPGAEVFTDSLPSYKGLETEYIHKVIDHAESYAEGKVHTNGLENFWSLLKRSIKGTYVSVEPYHLFRYLDEQAYRFNTRHSDDARRFEGIVSTVSGRRLTYKGLTDTMEAS